MRTIDISPDFIFLHLIFVSIGFRGFMASGSTIVSTLAQSNDVNSRMVSYRVATSWERCLGELIIHLDPKIVVYTLESKKGRENSSTSKGIPESNNPWAAKWNASNSSEFDRIRPTPSPISLADRVRQTIGSTRNRDKVCNDSPS